MSSSDDNSTAIPPITLHQSRKWQAISDATSRVTLRHLHAASVTRVSDQWVNTAVDTSWTWRNHDEKQRRPAVRRGQTTRVRCVIDLTAQNLICARDGRPLEGPTCPDSPIALSVCPQRATRSVRPATTRNGRKRQHKARIARRFILVLDMALTRLEQCTCTSLFSTRPLR